MNWNSLDIDDLRYILSEEETKRLNEYSVLSGMTEIVNGTIAMVSDTWRGALAAKGYKLDKRPH